MSTVKKAPARFKVGDWVEFRYGTKNLTAQVAESRGPLGVNQRHLYRVRVAREVGEPDSFEMPEDELAAASPPDTGEILKYLKDGGLVTILRSNLSGGKDQPRAWVTLTPRGRVTHTFVAEQGLIGGAVVPFFSLHEGRIFTAKRPEVLSFLESFGLGRAAAEEVVSAVGTAP